MSGSTFEQPWIVVDTVDDPNRHRYSKHHLDPQRPFVVVPGRNGRCRYEFMLLPGESAEHMLSWPSLEALLRPHREVVREQVIRSVVYTFHALLAERWRVGVCSSLAMPPMMPMAGQGLNSASVTLTTSAGSWRWSSLDKRRLTCSTPTSKSDVRTPPR
jgi:3-(3-hydroxy-phenyl)propionate hydroxylase